MNDQIDVQTLKLYFKVVDGVLLRFRYSDEAWHKCGTPVKNGRRSMLRTNFRNRPYFNQVIAYAVQFDKIPTAVRCIDGDYMNLSRSNLIEVPKFARTPKDIKTPGVFFRVKHHDYRSFVTLPRSVGTYTIGYYEKEAPALFAAQYAKTLVSTLDVKGFAPDEIVNRLDYFRAYLNRFEEQPGNQNASKTFQARFRALCETPHGGKKEFDLFY